MLDDIPTDDNSAEASFCAPKRDKKPPTALQFFQRLRLPRFGRIFIITFIGGLSGFILIKAMNYIGAVIWPNQTAESQTNTNVNTVKIVMAEPTVFPVAAQNVPLQNENENESKKVSENKSENESKDQILNVGISNNVEVSKVEETHEVKTSNNVAVSNLKTPTPEISSVKKNYSNAENQLLKRNPKHYTLQILALHDKTQINQILKKAALNDKVLLYSTQYQGKPWFVAVYGDYATLIEAKQALAALKLPDNIKNSKPWPKRYSAIHKDISHKDSRGK